MYTSTLNRKYENYFMAFGSRVDFGILEQAWKESYHQVIQKLSCGLNLKTDGSEDHLIHCVKEAQPCANGLDMLNEQQNLLSNAEYLNSNLFEIKGNFKSNFSNS